MNLWQHLEIWVNDLVIYKQYVILQHTPPCPFVQFSKVFPKVPGYPQFHALSFVVPVQMLYIKRGISDNISQNITTENKIYILKYSTKYRKWTLHKNLKGKLNLNLNPFLCFSSLPCQCCLGYVARVCQGLHKIHKILKWHKIQNTEKSWNIFWVKLNMVEFHLHSIFL